MGKYFNTAAIDTTGSCIASNERYYSEQVAALLPRERQQQQQQQFLVVEYELPLRRATNG